MLKIGKWPLVAACTLDNETNDDNGYGIKLYNMEKELFLKRVKCVYATCVNFYGNILLSCGNFVNEYEHTIAMRIWNMDEVMDDSINIEEVRHREISPILCSDHCSLLMIGSNILTTEGTQLIQRSFLP